MIIKCRPLTPPLPASTAVAEQTNDLQAILSREFNTLLLEFRVDNERTGECTASFRDYTPETKIRRVLESSGFQMN